MANSLVKESHLRSRAISINIPSFLWTSALLPSQFLILRGMYYFVKTLLHLTKLI